MPLTLRMHRYAAHVDRDRPDADMLGCGKRMAMPAPLCRAWLAGAGQCALPDRIADDRYHARSIGRPPEPPPST